MFSKRKTTDVGQRETRSVPSLISADVQIVGTLSSDGEMQVDGKVDGNIRSSKVVIGGAGVVNGEIVAEEVVVKGEVNGPIRGVKVHLADGARVCGDILHGTLAVETGAIFEGSIRRSNNPLEELKKLPSPAAPSADAKPAKKPAKSRPAKSRTAKQTAVANEEVEPTRVADENVPGAHEDDTPAGDQPPVSTLAGSQAAD